MYVQISILQITATIVYEDPYQLFEEASIWNIFFGQTMSPVISVLHNTISCYVPRLEAGLVEVCLVKGGQNYCDPEVVSDTLLFEYT
jgi:hypothetical protein